MPPDLLTIGYEGCTIDGVLTTLEGGPGRAADRRARGGGVAKAGLLQTPTRRGSGPGGDRLSSICSVSARRNPAVTRSAPAIRSGWCRFSARIWRRRKRQLALAEAKALAVERRCCLLCFERDHRHCHRHLVAEMIVAETGQAIDHLEVPSTGRRHRDVMFPRADRVLTACRPPRGFPLDNREPRGA